MWHTASALSSAFEKGSNTNDFATIYDRSTTSFKRRILSKKKF